MNWTNHWVLSAQTVRHTKLLRKWEWWHHRQVNCSVTPEQSEIAAAHRVTCRFSECKQHKSSLLWHKCGDHLLPQRTAASSEASGHSSTPSQNWSMGTHFDPSAQEAPSARHIALDTQRHKHLTNIFSETIWVTCLCFLTCCRCDGRRWSCCLVCFLCRKKSWSHSHSFCLFSDSETLDSLWNCEGLTAETTRVWNRSDSVPTGLV